MIKNKIACIGLGACGSNIALLFQKRGYTTLFINGSEQDNKSLGTARNILRLTGFDGCGGDRDLAMQALAENLEILEEIKKIKEDVIFLIFSTAGSTGSGLAPVLCDVIEELNQTEGFGKTVCCIAVLPKKEEALQKHINAYNCIRELAEKPELGCCLLIDNSKMDSLEKINSTLVHQLNFFFCDESYSAKGNVDVSEKMKLLKQQGMMYVSVVCSGKSKGADYLEHLLVKNIFAPIEKDGIIEYLAVINAAEITVDAEAVIKEVGIPQNVFLGFNGKKTITVLSGLSFPIGYLTKIREEAERIWGDRMQSRNKVGGILKDLNFDNTGIPVVQEPPTKRKLNRLELLRGLRKGVN